MSSLIRKIISTSRAPKVVAPYNQAVLLDRTLYVSGVLGLDKNTLKLVEGGAAAEARQALTWLGYILEDSGSSYEKVIKSTLFLANMNDFADVNVVYKEFFKSNFPARSAFQVAKLPLNANVEIEVIAAVGDVTHMSSTV
ncbi:hypothetical protein Zmor_022730 [Zophobas morio]|uniref:Uncharacterized protein n=1 Tax=Zophobas morio TaxID=2755281 RepID=A0AA38HVS1_9CUCU|nr:hypothetical protein Zmor_022730 [Zophobas morio]